jgi:uncharacterized protein (DUF58 family)
MRRRSSIWLSVAVILLIAGLLWRQAPLVLVGALLTLVEVMTRLWESHGLDKVVYERKLSAARVFCGEEIHLESRITNGKPLPLPWISVEDEIPHALNMLTGKASPSPNPGRMEITNLFPLMWYEKVTRRYRVGCPVRGFYTFGPTRIATGDILGLVDIDERLSKTDDLIVYPKIVPLDKLGIPSTNLFGEVRGKRRIFEDPILTLGIRDYQSGDSLKRIHWKSTARSGRLQTKLFEPSTTMDMGIFLDVRTTMPPMWGTFPQLTELGIVAAASLCYHAMLEGFRVGLYVNEWRYQGKEPIRIPPSQHAAQLPQMLETLARIDAAPSECLPMPTFVLQEGTALPLGSAIVVISAAPTEGLASSLHKMKRAGRVVALVAMGEVPAPGPDSGLSVYRIPPDVRWQDLKSLSFME